MTGSRDLVYLCRELKHPSLLAGVERLGERARADAWSHEDFLAACLEREVSARQSHGGEARIKAAHFPARKTLEDFDFEHQRSVRADVVAHLGALDFIEAKSNAVFLGPPGTGKSHLSIALGVRACLAGHRVAFATAAEWVDRLGAAHDAGKLQEELRRLGRVPLVIIDEVGYIPFQGEAANCQRPSRSPHRRPSECPADGHRNSPRTATRTPRGRPQVSPRTATGVPADSV